MRDFVAMAPAQVSDVTRLLKFRRLLVADDETLAGAIFNDVNAQLGERGFLKREGTLGDASTGLPSTVARAAAFVQRGRRAIVNAVDLSFGQKRPVGARVALFARRVCAGWLAAEPDCRCRGNPMKAASTSRANPPSAALAAKPFVRATATPPTPALRSQRGIPKTLSGIVTATGCA